MVSGFRFEHRKTTQALNFFAIQNGGAIDKLRALKLVFFADRYHLREYGRPVTNDQYWAMRLGPVPSATKDLFEMDTTSREERHYAEKFFAKGIPPHTIRSIAAVDTSVLSASDREALDFAWRTAGRRSRIVERTHVYPEWKRHAAALKGDSTRVPMDYLDFLDDPEPDINDFRPLTPDQRRDRQEQIADLTDAVALWR
jgi:hypothetical protein